MRHWVWLIAASSIGFCAGCTEDTHPDLPPAAAIEQQVDNAAATPPPPVSANTRFAAGQLAETNGDVDEAIAQYRLALRIDPNNQPALYRIGILYTGQKQYDEAIDAWQRYVKATGQSASAYANLGFCLELAGKPELAESAYLVGINREPDNVPCRTNYGLLLARQGRVDNAVAVWQPILTPAQIHFNLARVYEATGNAPLAKAEYQKAAQLDPKVVGGSSAGAQ